MIEPIPVAPPKTGLQYRELMPEEIQSIAHVFEATGNPLPPTNSSFFVGAVEDGKVIGFLVVQAKLHAEPMWIQPGKSQIFGSLAKKAEELILQKVGPAYVYLFAPAGKVSQLAATAGMSLEPWNIWSKLVMPEMPQRGAVDLLRVDPEDEDGDEEPILVSRDEDGLAFDQIIIPEGDTIQ